MSARSLILRRNLVFFYLSWIAVGLTNVAPQHFFARAAPESRQAWLVSALLLGTLASLLGVKAAGRLGFGGRPLLGGLLSLFGTTGLLLLGLWVSAPILYVALHVATRGAANFSTQELDRRAVALAHEESAENDHVGTGLRFFGMLLGPLWFGLFPDASLAALLCFTALSFLSLLSVLSLKDAPPVVAEVKEAPGESPQRLSPSAKSPARRALVWGAMFIYGAYYLLASNLIYVLGARGAVENATRWGGLLITAVYGAAILTTFALPRFAPRGLSLRASLAAPLALGLAALALHSPLLASYVGSLGVALGLGVSFAIFLLSFRGYTSQKAREGEEGWVEIFNNLANQSALVGFGVMGLLVLLEQLWGLPFLWLLSAGLLLLCGAGFIAGLAGVRGEAREGSAR